jgi:hypothetical protein
MKVKELKMLSLKALNKDSSLTPHAAVKIALKQY